jgi:hypothetical protein
VCVSVARWIPDADAKPDARWVPVVADSWWLPVLADARWLPHLTADRRAPHRESNPRRFPGIPAADRAAVIQLHPVSQRPPLTPTAGTANPRLRRLISGVNPALCGLPHQILLGQPTHSGVNPSDVSGALAVEGCYGVQVVVALQGGRVEVGVRPERG